MHSYINLNDLEFTNTIRSAQPRRLPDEAIQHRAQGDFEHYTDIPKAHKKYLRPYAPQHAYSKTISK